VNTITQLLKYLILGGSLVLAAYLCTGRNFVIVTYTPNELSTSNSGVSTQQASQDAILLDTRTGRSWILVGDVLGIAKKWRNINHYDSNLPDYDRKQWTP